MQSRQDSQRTYLGKPMCVTTAKLSFGATHGLTRASSGMLQKLNVRLQ